MTKEYYMGRDVQVIDFDDAAVGEHVIEFVDPAISESDSIVAIYNRGESWESAQVTISPRVGEVSATFMLWALSVARRKMEPGLSSDEQKGFDPSS